MSQGSELTQSLQSSANLTAGIEGRQVSGNTVEVFYGAVTSKKPSAVSAARRSSLTSSDATASLAAATYTDLAIDAGNSIHAMLSCRFSVTAMSATVFFALYDSANALIGITRDYMFTGGSNTDGTLYIGGTEIVDIGPASKIVPVLKSAPSSGNVSIYVEMM